MFVTVDQKKKRMKRRGGNEMYIFLLYLGFNLLNISKTAGSSVFVYLFILILFLRTSEGQK